MVSKCLLDTTIPGITDTNVLRQSLQEMWSGRPNYKFQNLPTESWISSNSVNL